MISTGGEIEKVIPAAIRVLSPGYKKSVNHTRKEVRHETHLSTY